MKLRVDVPPEVLSEIVERVAERVLAELAANDRFPAQGTTSPFLNVGEGAQYLRCSRQRIYDLLSQRRLSRVKDGNRTLLRRDEIEEHLKVEERRP